MRRGNRYDDEIGREEVLGMLCYLELPFPNKLKSRVKRYIEQMLCNKEAMCRINWHCLSFVQLKGATVMRSESHLSRKHVFRAMAIWFSLLCTVYLKGKKATVDIL